MNNEMEKIEIIQELAKDTTKNAEKILLDLINDASELVRANVCDSLYNNTATRVVKALIKKLNNDTDLVKYYCVLSLGDIAKSSSENKNEILNNLFILKDINKNTKVNIAISKVLYELGNKEQLDVLLEYLKDSDYQNRCVTLNCISEIINRDNSSKIISFLNKTLKIEKTTAVKESIKNIIKSINKEL